MSTVPIFAPDGSLRDVPQEQAQEALRQGGALGVSMVSPDGEGRIVHMDDVGKARQAGAVLTGSRATPGVPQPNMDISAGQRLAGFAGSIPERYQSNTQTVPGNSFSGAVQNIGSGAADTLIGGPASALAHPLQTIQGLGSAYLHPEELLSPYADALQKGGISGLLERIGGQAAGAFMGGKTLEAAMPESAVAGQNYTPSQASAFEGVTSTPAGMGKQFIPQKITPQALSEIRNTASTMPDVLETARNGEPVSQLDALHQIIRKSGQNLEAQHTPLLQMHGQMPADVQPLVQNLQSKISPTMDPSDVSAINQLISRTKNAATLNDLNRFRTELNTEDSPAYRQTLIQQGRTGVSAEAVHDLANQVRGSYYDQLQQASGVDMQPIKQKESALMSTREAVENMQSPVAKAEAQHNAPNTARGTVGQVGEAFSNPKKFVTQSVLREGPNARLSMLIRKSLENIQP